MSFKPLYTVTRRVPGDISNRVVRFVMSTEREDRAGDTISADGWNLENYLRNPVVLWCHEQGEPPIGKCVQIGVEANRLVGDVEFASADVNPFADTVFKLVEAGFVSAGSVGFKPLRWEINDKGGLDFKEQELLEFSIVGVPCNPQALRKMQSAGLSLDETARAFIEMAAADETARADYLEDARTKAARSFATFKRAHDLRAREFQLGRRVGA